MGTNGDIPSDDATRFAGSDATRMAGGGAGPAREPDVPAQLGPYKILKRVGGGGMGNIYLAEQTTIRRQVALKVLPPGFLEGSEAHERFQREVQVLGQLSHPNICPVLEAGRDGDTYYYAMEYLRGLDLAKVLKTQRMEPRRAAEIAVQVLRALQFAHDKGVVHRDLKPHNIMLVRGEKPRSGSMAVASTKLSLVQRIFGGSAPKAAAAPAAESGVADPHLPGPEWQDHAVLIDFGLARDGTQRSTKLTITGAVVGTPAYMSPEQARGDQKAIGALSDLYALGAVLYESLALRAPFEGETVAQIIHNVIETDARPLRAVNPALDREIETVVSKAMEKDPARRYTSAGAFADDLERWLAGEPILARPASLAYRLRKKIARNRLASAVIVFSALLVGVMLWFAYTPGTLAVTSEPSGAEVWVDEVKRGVTPYRGKWLPGPRRLELRLAGYEMEKEHPRIESGEETPVHRRLRHETGLLTLTSDPSEVGLELTRADGKTLKIAAPATEQIIETGVWKARATARNHFPREFELHVERGRTARRHVTLNPLVLWTQWTGGPNQTMLAHDVNSDGRLDLVGVFSDPMRLVALDGVRGTLLWNAEVEPLNPAANIRVDAGDLDGDFVEEVILVDGSERLLVFDGARGRLVRSLRIPGVRMAWIHDDVSGDGLSDVVALSSGACRMLRGDDLSEVWAVGLEGRLGWACEGRFHKDGARDVAVLAIDHGIVALDGRTGAALWRADVPRSGAFWTADMDGDGLDEVSGVTPEFDLYAASGTDGSLLYRHRYAEMEPLLEPCFVNIDDDPQPEIVRRMDERVVLIDGRSGEIQSEIREPMVWAQAVPADVDGDGRTDLIYPSIEALVAADPRTGKILWKYQADSAIFRHPVLADFNGDGRTDVAVATWSGNVSVLEVQDPPVVWRQEAGGWISSGPSAVGDPVRAVVCGVKKLDPKDGGVLATMPGIFSTAYGGAVRIDGRDWHLVHAGAEILFVDPDSFEVKHRGPQTGMGAPDRIDLTGDGIPEFVVGDDWIGNRRVVSFDARTGVPIWTAEHLRPHRARAALCGGLLWLPGDGIIAGLDPLTGARRAEIPVSGPAHSVCARNGRLLFADATGRLSLTSPPAGAAAAVVAWTLETGLELTPESPLHDGDFACALSSDGILLAFDPDRGRILWRHNLREACESVPAFRDLDGDGVPEVAVATHAGLVAVLDGKTGRARWRFRAGGEFATITPSWADLDGDGRPELMVATQLPTAYAFRVSLEAPPPEFWPSHRTRSDAVAREALRLETTRRAVLEGEWSGNDAWILDAARAHPTAWSCARAARAAERAGDATAARDLAARAAALGARDLELDWIRARLSPAAEAETPLARALERARPDRIAALAPADADRPLLGRAALAAARARADAGDWERAALLFDLAGEDAAVESALQRAPGPDPGPLHLARARVALRHERFEEAIPALREAARFAPSRADAEEILADLDREARALRLRGAELRNVGGLRASIPVLARAARLLPESAGIRRDLAASLVESSDATAEERRAALDHAREALRLLEAQSPADRLARAVVLDTLAATHFANGDPREAARREREALALPVAAASKPAMETRLAQYEAAEH